MYVKYNNVNMATSEINNNVHFSDILFDEPKEKKEKERKLGFLSLLKL